MSEAALVSLGAHAVVAFILFGGTLIDRRRPPAPPDQPAEVEIVIGSNAHENGTPSTPPAPTDEAALGPPPLPAEPDPAASDPMPRPAGNPAKTALEPPRSRPPTHQAPPLQAPRAAQSPEQIHIGDGVAASFAEIAGDGRIRKAEAESGNEAPAYPLAAARHGEHGTVVLRIFIDVDGSVSQVQILHSSGSRTLDSAARDRVKTWHFRPAVINGLPVPDIQEQDISFVLE